MGIVGEPKDCLIPLKRFVEYFWDVVEPGCNFSDNWHIDSICYALTKTQLGDYRDVAITIPPGCMKSLLVSVFFPAWVWTYDPGHRFIVSSFDAALTRRDALKSLEIMNSERYQFLWGHKFRLPSDPAASDFTNSAKGWRFSTSVEGKATGRHADTHIYDDLIKPLAISEVTLEKAKRYLRETMPSRFRDLKTSSRIIIAQRLHEEDPVGELLKDDTFTLFTFPMRYETSNRCDSDRRTEDGELLWESRFPKEAVDAQEKALGSRAFAAQYQQRPAPESGNLFQRAWFKTYQNKPEKFDRTIQSWDLAFKDSDDSDFVCGLLIGKAGNDYYLLDMVKQRLNFPSTLAAIRSKAKDPIWGKAIVKLVEDKANGPAVISTLEKEITGILAVTPEGGKLARANAVAPLVEAGHFYVPEFAAWVDDYLTSMCGFPFMAHDDDVDATSQALLYLHSNNIRFHEAMKKVREGQKK